MKRKQRWETEKGFIVVGSIVVESVVVGSVVIETIFVGSVVVESVGSLDPLSYLDGNLKCNKRERWGSGPIEKDRCRFLTKIL